MGSSYIHKSTHVKYARMPMKLACVEKVVTSSATTPNVLERLNAPSGGSSEIARCSLRKTRANSNLETSQKRQSSRRRALNSLNHRDKQSKKLNDIADKVSDSDWPKIVLKQKQRQPLQNDSSQTSWSRLITVLIRSCIAFADKTKKVAM